MTRDEALEELKLRLFNKEVLQRSIVIEEIMKEFARHYNADVDIWGMAGLLHDIDYDKTRNDPMSHGITGAGIIENFEVDGAIAYSVQAHNDLLGISRKRKMDKVLYLSDFVYEAIIKCASTLPDKKVSSVTVENLNNKDFLEFLSKNTEYFEELSMTSEDFIKTSLKVIQRVLEHPL
jgi:putative nucleotidyltransferase with HDIG domain